MPSRTRLLTAWIWPVRSVSRWLWPMIAAGAIYTSAVCVVCTLIEGPEPTWLPEFGLINTVVVGALVSFRTKAAYDRWWEGRSLWGQLTNESRNLCLKASALANPCPADRAELARLLVAFAVALTNHLRSSNGSPTHAPAVVAGGIVRLIAGWRTTGAIDGHSHRILDAHTSALMAVCGGCERIRSTPLPATFLILLRHGLILGLVLTPWHLALTYGVWAIPMQAILIYFLFGIELTAEQVEQPFADDPDDLPLERYCGTIRASVEEILEVGEGKPAM